MILGILKFLIGQGLNMEYIAQLEDKIEDLIDAKKLLGI